MWLQNQTWNGITAFFFEKRYNIFGEEKTQAWKQAFTAWKQDFTAWKQDFTVLLWIRTSQIAEEKKNSRREKRHEQNRIENDEKVENLLRKDESDGK